jgi:hypothetical protein
MKGMDHDPSIPQAFRARHRPGRPFAENKFPISDSGKRSGKRILSPLALWI